MAISSDYPTPVQVNGFTCRNCTDVGNAKKHIDPQDPKSGPYGINESNRPDAGSSDAVSFGGRLAGLSFAASTTPVRADGLRVDIRA